jgi:hypothetical protein
MSSVTVRYDRASARRHQRVTAPARVEIDGRPYATKDWSVGGFRVTGFEGEPRIGERRPIRFYVNFQGFEIGFEAQVKVCAFDVDQRSISAEFQELGQRETELLRHFVAGVSSGEMTSVSETIVHMDSPTSIAHWGRAPLAGADPLAEEAMKKRSRLTAALYFAIGPLVAGYALLTGYQTLFRMDIENAVVVRPTETVVAQGIGSVESMNVQQGQIVAAGQPLFTLLDQDQGRDLRSAGTTSSWRAWSSSRPRARTLRRRSSCASTRGSRGTSSRPPPSTSRRSRSRPSRRRRDSPACRPSSAPASTRPPSWTRRRRSTRG